MEVAQLYTESVNYKAQPLQAVGPILTAMHPPAAIEQETPAPEEDLLSVARSYSEVCADFAHKYKRRDSVFFGIGHYRNYFSDDGAGSDEG